MSPKISLAHHYVESRISLIHSCHNDRGFGWKHKGDKYAPQKTNREETFSFQREFLKFIFLNNLVTFSFILDI